MDKKIAFNEEQKQQIKLALADHLYMTEEQAQDNFIKIVEETGTLNAFGAGSLLTYSHLQNADKAFKDDIATMFPGIDPETVFQVTPATLNDYVKDFVCFDIHYRGTPEKPGITIGNEPKEGAKTPGGILETKIDHLDPNIAANFVAYYLEKFNIREAPPNMPVYKFEMIDVQVSDGRIIPGIVCVADQNGPLYIYNPENRFAQQSSFYHFTRGPEDDEKKAYIMAAAYNEKNPDGKLKGPGAVTDLDYLRNMINDSLEKGIEVESRFHKLYASAVLARMKLDPAESRKLEGFEHQDKRGNMPQLLGPFMISIGDHTESVRRKAANDSYPPEEELIPLQK